VPGVSTTALRLGVCTVIVCTLTAAAVPMLRGSFPAGHDASAHLTYTYLFDRALAEGQFPVRWIEWVRPGYGHPLFNFYQPGLYYIVEAIHVVVPSLTLSLKLAVVFLWWLGALFLYLLLARLGRLPAAAGAISFALAPYLVLDVFVRAAFPEIAGIAFGVGVLWTLDGWLRTTRRVWAAACAASIGLMIVSHPPTALIFIPAIAAYAATLLAARRTTIKAVLAIVPIGALAVGLAAFYIVPAVFELGSIGSADLTAGGFDFHRHFVFPTQWVTSTWGFGSSVDGLADGMSFQLGLVQWLAIIAAIGVVAFKLRWRRGDAPAADLVCWLIVAGLALLLTTSASAPVWDAVAPMAFVQYPWRFLILAAVAAAILLAQLLAMVRLPRLRAALVLCTIVMQVQLSHTRLQPSGYIPQVEINIDRPDWPSTSSVSQHAFIEKAYFPRSANRNAPPRLERWNLTPEAAYARETIAKGHELELEVTAWEPTELTINTQVFPGWKVWLDGRPMRLPANGYLNLALPEGPHHVRAEFTNTRVRTVANTITLLSLGVLAGTALAASAARYAVWRSWKRQLSVTASPIF
jgi:uncharacterized membrane protein